MLSLSEVNTDKINKIERIRFKIKNIFKSEPWQTTLVARHEDRPKAKFFIEI